MKKLVLVLFWSGLSCACFASEQKNLALKAVAAPSQALERPSAENEEGIVLFTPPQGWKLAEVNALPSHVRAMVVGSGPSSFPPSINLSWEPYQGTLKQYLKTVKNLNSAQGYDWKDLGSIKTEAGNGSLSQVDTKSQWGEVRLMHVIMIKNGYAYILTASALKDEFSIFYKDFFAAMRSLRVAQDMYEMIADPQQRLQLKSAATSLKNQWTTLVNKNENAHPGKNRSELQKSLFESQEFQNNAWKPFQDMLKLKYGNSGPEWQTLFLKKMEDQLY